MPGKKGKQRENIPLRRTPGQPACSNAAFRQMRMRRFLLIGSKRQRFLRIEALHNCHFRFRCFEQEAYMAFISEIIGRPVTDLDGKLVGTVKDLVARSWNEWIHPVIEAVVVKAGAGELNIPLSAVVALLAPALPLKDTTSDLPAYTSTEHDIFLVKDVLDKQIIDTDGARVVRVNDLELCAQQEDPGKQY
jgi:sporulation protein YlmC with PRC-barrel domain